MDFQGDPVDMSGVTLRGAVRLKTGVTEFGFSRDDEGNGVISWASVPAGMWSYDVFMDDGSEERGQTLGEWLEADLDSRTPVSVRFEVPVFELVSPEFPLDLKAARRYRYRFDPADTGVRDFHDWPLEIRGDLLAPPDAPQGQGFRKADRR